MDEVLKLLAGSGALGVVTYMLLTQINPKLDALGKGLYERMRAMEAAADRNAEATALRLIASPHISEEIKERASYIIEATKLAKDEREKA